MSAEGAKEVKIGVLALQGSFSEHVRMLEAERNARRDARRGREKVEIVVEEVRRPEQLDRLDGLIIPGGESTTLNVFLRQNGFGEKLKSFARGSGCVWGTCAGLILLADQLDSQKEGGQLTVGGIDVQVTRNAYGKQINSFEAPLKITDSTLLHQPSGHTHQHPTIGEECSGVFIRAPGIVKVNSDLVVTLATLDRGTGERAVGVRQGRLMATAFHPELTSDLRWHSYFIDMVINNVLSS